MSSCTAYAPPRLRAAHHPTPELEATGVSIVSEDAKRTVTQTEYDFGGASGQRVFARMRCAMALEIPEAIDECVEGVPVGGSPQACVSIIRWTKRSGPSNISSMVWTG